jgi:hypothetical protein
MDIENDCCFKINWLSNQPQKLYRLMKETQMLKGKHENPVKHM